MIELDARGKACPIPVIMAKKQADQGSKAFTVIVDNKIAVENLRKFGNSLGFNITVNEQEDYSYVVFSTNKSAELSTPIKTSDYVVFIGNEIIGGGSKELGSSLMEMFLFTLAQKKDLPSHILLMNSGVKLAVYSEQAIIQLDTLQQSGTKIFVCGTCLNYYGISDKLKIGEISNMYDITEAMIAANKVISL